MINEASNKSNYNVENNANSVNTNMANNNNNNDTLELDNSSFSLKNQQLEIIKNNNPAEDNYHTWIRNINDIKTYEETLNDADSKEHFDVGEDFDETYTVEMAKKH